MCKSGEEQRYSVLRSIYCLEGNWNIHFKFIKLGIQGSFGFLDPIPMCVCVCVRVRVCVCVRARARRLPHTNKKFSDASWMSKNSNQS